MRQPEKTQRSLPSELRLVAASRTSSAVETLRTCMEEWEKELRNPNSKFGQTITLKDLTTRAGLNPKFLYGRLHKDTTRLEAEQWVERVNKMLQQKKQTVASNSVSGQASSDAAYWEARYRKLARHANRWLLELRDLQRSNRDLRERRDTNVAVLDAGQTFRRSRGKSILHD